MNTTLTWNGDAFERVVREAAAKRLLAAGLLFQAAAKQDLSVANPPPKFESPAPRGQFPKARTYGGRDSVALDPPDLATLAKTLTLRVGVLKGGRHLVILMFKGWKGLRDTLARVMPQIRAVMGGGGSVEGKSG